ncbi:MAG: hypothetical protein ACOC2U_01125 [bacterium]
MNFKTLDNWTEEDFKFLNDFKRKHKDVYNTLRLLWFLFGALTVTIFFALWDIFIGI